tara:strand:+ start:236 stop:538 length:303 start_codon:yes stop_codon:yes gene_type:complete
LKNGSIFALLAAYSPTDDVHYSPFENEKETAQASDRLDLRATWTSNEQNIVVSAFCDNVSDEVGVLQVLRHGKAEHRRQTAGMTMPRMYGLELTYKMGAC